MAQDGVPLGAGCDKKQVGPEATSYDKPNCQTEEAFKAWVTPAQCPQWVADAQVVVLTDASEEKDAAVEVPVEEKANEFAEPSAKGPVFVGCIIVDEGE